MAAGESVNRSAQAPKASLSVEEFAERYESAYSTLWCIAAGVTNSRALADDVCQDAAVIGLQKIDSFSAGTSFTAWMGQVVRHVARNHARKAARRSGPTLDESTDMPAAHKSAGYEVDEETVDPSGRLSPEQEAFNDEVTRALAHLEESARACLLLRIVLGKTYAEIAETLDIPEGTAMSHVHRARRKLRSMLSEGDPSSHD